MKSYIIAAALSILTLTAFSQNADLRRKIEVTGSAEQEVTPDIIYIGISLKEYFKDNANKKKTTIDELEKQLQTAVLKAGIPPEDFTINNISSYTNYWEKKKDPNFLASKQYSIKVGDLNKLNQIIGAVDSKGIAYTNIEKYDYSKIESLKKDLKIKALKNAKDRAQYMVEALGDKLGSVLEINDNSNESYPQPVYRTNMMMIKSDSMAEAAMPEIDFKKIKLSYQIRTIFEIK